MRVYLAQGQEATSLVRVSLGAGLHVSLDPGAPRIAPPGADLANTCGGGVLNIPVFGRNLPRS